MSEYSNHSLEALHIMDHQGKWFLELVITGELVIASKNQKSPKLWPKMLDTVKNFVQTWKNVSRLGETENCLQTWTNVSRLGETENIDLEKCLQDEAENFYRLGKMSGGFGETGFLDIPPPPNP